MNGKNNLTEPQEQKIVTVEYGKENTEVIILLHGGGLSWWNYREVAEQLQENYHVILPILDGHAGSKRNFSSIEENAEELIRYIDEEHQGSVALIGGVSLGGQILAEMLARRRNICRYAIIESALVIPMKLTHRLVKPMMDASYGLISQRWFSKLQFSYLRMKNELYEEYYRDTCKITKENMIAFLRSNSNYTAKKELEKVTAKVWIFAGEKEERKMIQSARVLNELIPESTLEIMSKRYHGEFSMNHAKEYADWIMKHLEKR